MNFKRVFFIIVVLLIILAFSASFFSAGIRSLSSDEEDSDAPDQQTESAQEDTEEVSPFIQSIKSSMVESEDIKDNANNIAKVINVFNSLTTVQSDKILSFIGNESDFGEAKTKLKNMGIYFDDINVSAEKAAWEIIDVDEDGIASVN